MFDKFQEIYDAIPKSVIGNPIRINLSKFQGLDTFEFKANEYIVIAHYNFPDHDVLGTCTTLKNQSGSEQYHLIAISDRINNPSELVTLKETITHEFLHIIDSLINRLLSRLFVDVKIKISPREAIHTLTKEGLSKALSDNGQLTAFQNFLNLEPETAQQRLLISDKLLNELWVNDLVPLFTIDNSGEIYFKEENEYVHLTVALTDFAKKNHVNKSTVLLRFQETFNQKIEKFKNEITKKST